MQTGTSALRDERTADPASLLHLVQGESQIASLMHSAFEEASVSEEAIEALEDSMDNDPGDRQVLAAAIAGDAEPIITPQHEPAGERR